MYPDTYVFYHVFYGMATVSRIDKMLDFFAEYSLFCMALSQERPII